MEMCVNISTTVASVSSPKVQKSSIFSWLPLEESCHTDSFSVICPCFESVHWNSLDTFPMFQAFPLQELTVRKLCRVCVYNGLHHHQCLWVETFYKCAPLSPFVIHCVLTKLFSPPSTLCTYFKLVCFKHWPQPSLHFCNHHCGRKN